MKGKIKTIALVILIAVSGYFLYTLFVTSGSRDLETEKAVYTVSAESVFDEFLTDSHLASKKYLDKAIAITGTVTSTNDSVIVLDGKISCQLKQKQKVELKSLLQIKGRVTGYDDLLEELKLDQCSIVN